MGGKFIAKTNHNSLRHFLTQKEFNVQKKKSVSKVHSYDFNIEYKKGKMNVVAYALSRNPTFSLLQMFNEWKIQLVTKYSKDQFSCEFLEGKPK